MRRDVIVVHDCAGSYVDWISDNPTYDECLHFLEFNNYTLGLSPPHYPVPATQADNSWCLWYYWRHVKHY